MKYEWYDFADGSVYKVEAGRDGITDDDMRVLKRIVKGSQKTDAKVNRLDTVSVEVVTEDGWEDVDVAVTVEEQDEYQRLHKAIEALTTEQQSLIRKIYFQGISQREAARAAGVSDKKIRNQLKEIYASLKISLE